MAADGGDETHADRLSKFLADAEKSEAESAKVARVRARVEVEKMIDQPPYTDPK